MFLMSRKRLEEENCFLFFGASKMLQVNAKSCIVAEPVEPKLFEDLEPEPEPKINLKKHFLQSVWTMP